MKYQEMLNSRTPQQIIKHVEIRERVVRSVKQNPNVINKDSALYNRISCLTRITIKDENKKERIRKLFK